MSAPKRIFNIQGMDCAEEIAILRKEVGPVAGGEAQLAFDLLNGRMIVAEGASASSADILAAVGRTGMKAEPWREDGDDASASGRRKVQRVLLAVGFGMTGAGFLFHALRSGSLIAPLGSEGAGLGAAVPGASRIAYLAAIAASLWLVAPKAWASLRRLRPDMNLLMAVAVFGAILIGEWFEGATVAFLFAVSNALEAWSLHRARRAVEALMRLAPETAHVVEGNALADRQAREVPVGATFLVKPGERIPLDGDVLEGASAVNQAPITGESVPVPKSPGQEVFAGSINGDGALKVRSTKPASETVLGRIIQMIGEAQGRRSASEQWVDRFARIYTPVVMAAAILVALAPLVTHAPWMPWIYPALVLLVIACPCALVISTPVSVVAGLAAAARQGILIKGGLYLEVPARVKALAFDKTGTLTEGMPRVVLVEPADGISEADLLRIAGALESQSNHPLARAAMSHLASKGIPPAAATDVQALPGQGVEGLVEGRRFWLGSHRFFETRAEETPEAHARLEALSGEGRSVMALGEGRKLLGFLAVEDPIRPGAAGLMRELSGLGVSHLVMLTGDNQGTAAAVAARTGLTEVRAELLPEDKVKAIEGLVQAYGEVAMIGDGVNDAPAMARASLGIAMGAMGSDAAIETADIALMKDDLSRLPWLIRHARRTLGVIRQNISFSLAVKVLFVALTLMGHASLWAAIAADMGASLLVIFNGLRLLRT